MVSCTGECGGHDPQAQPGAPAAGPDQVRIIFYRDDLFRIWLGPEGNFVDYPTNPDDAPIVVFKGVPIAIPVRDAGEYFLIALNSCPLSRCL